MAVVASRAQRVLAAQMVMLGLQAAPQRSNDESVARSRGRLCAAARHAEPDGRCGHVSLSLTYVGVVA
jgi:hypothetical protein